ncbi:MAG: DoxX family protein [Ginsengibacter sp.]|jgi:putative oxidoreductase
MKKFLTTKYSPLAFNIGMLTLRVMLGVLLMHHGYAKLIRHGEIKNSFMSFMGMSSTTSLYLILFAELICGLFLILGLFTRFACVPIIIGMFVAGFVAMNGDIFGKAELPIFYMVAAWTILLCGPGKISVDGMIGK